MSRSSIIPRIVTIIRWIARIWSILIFVLALLVIITPDSWAVQPVPLTGWILLGFWGVAVLGLLIAWRWEGLGGAIAIASALAHVVGFCIITYGLGEWLLEAGAMAILQPSLFVAFLFVLPGVLFLVCWALSRSKRG